MGFWQGNISLNLRCVERISCPIQLDELWARVGVRQSRTNEWDTERGDFYTFLGIDRRTKLIISHLTGKRDYTSTNDFVADLAERVDGVVQITCDGWSPYVPTIRHHLLGRLNLAEMQKNYGSTSESNESKIDPNHRYSQPRCPGIKLKTVAGTPDLNKICTSHIERLNLTVRTFNRRFTRLLCGLVAQAGESSPLGGVVCHGLQLL